MPSTRLSKELKASVREFVFGAEDSLVSTFGTITGVAAGTGNAFVVILTAVVLIAVEATSMASGSYLSSISEQEVDGKRSSSQHLSASRGALVMWVSYVIAGFFPLAPYLFVSVSAARLPSFLLTVLALFGVGAFVGKLSRRSMWKDGLRMAAISLVAAAIGYGIGRLASQAIPGSPF